MGNRINWTGEGFVWASLVAVWVASFLYPYTPLNGEVLCIWKKVSGLGCFGCGLTRSFIAVSQGALLEAFGHHPVGPLLYAPMVLFVGVIPARIIMKNPAWLSLGSKVWSLYWGLCGVVFVLHAARVAFGWFTL